MRRTPHSGTAAETRIHSVEPVTEPQMLLPLLPSLTTSACFFTLYMIKLFLHISKTR